MDAVCDMDDLLNELEAAEMTGKLNYNMNDSIVNPKIVLLNTSNNFTDKQNTTHFLHNDYNEEMKNTCATGMEAIYIEATNVLTDLISSVSVNENDSLQCNVEVKSDSITGQVTDIPEYSKSENSISANITDITHDCKKDETRDSLSDHPGSYSNVIVNECKETNSEELFNKVTDEMDRISVQYSEMEQYLNSCDANSAVDLSKQQYPVSDTEISSIFFPSKTNESEAITVEATNKKYLSYEMDSDKNFQMASELGKETNEEIRDTTVEEIIKNATPELDATSCISTDEQSIDEVPHNTSMCTGENSELEDVQKNIDVCINGSTTSDGHLSSSCCAQLSSITEVVTAVNESDDETEIENQENDNEEEKQSELIENDSDHSASECRMQAPTIDKAQAISVVSSTYDISRDSGVKYLTESERQLGKKKPIWIDDKETFSCMICCIKFTVFVRRHHCRCCGRVLCARCTTQKASLSYVNNPKKEHRVCDPCFETLRRIEESEKNTNTGEPANTNEYIHSSDISPATKPVLKSRGKSEETISDDQGSSSNEIVRSGSSVKRSVTFRDGLHPGYNSNETQPSTVSVKSKKHDSKRQHVSRRLQQLHVTEEYVCLLPGLDIVSSDVTEALITDNGTVKNNCLYLRNSDGIITRCDNARECITSLKNFEALEVMIFRNLWCIIKLCKYDNKTVMCIISRGMSFVGLDEIFLAYYCDTEIIDLPIDYLWRICEIYQHSLTFRSELSSDEKLGIRLAHNRIPALNHTVYFLNSDKPVARDILLFRPSIQTFENFLVPSSSFLVGIFIYQSESIWANVIPQRLLFRLGLQASFYPTSIINDFNREPVYNSTFDTSVLKIFNDFRNWRFQMPIILGSTLMVRDNSESILTIPIWALEEIIKLIKANKNMIAWGLDFSPDADSYLVCKQDDNGSFSSQIFTNGVENRKVTGASFIVIDGALKDGGEPFTVNILEDGMTIRFRSDIMESLLEALSVGQDFEQISSGMKFSIRWNDDSYPQHFIGGLVSPIDSRSLIGCYQYGLKKSRILGSSYPIPNQAHWSLRLVSVYNIGKGRFVQRVQSKVFSVSEQVAAQIATTLEPFVTILIEHDLRHIFFRIRITTEDAEYKTQPWPGMEKEFAAWSDFLDYEVVPGLFTVCSYITVGFHAELHMALISIQPNP